MWHKLLIQIWRMCIRLCEHLAVKKKNTTKPTGSRFPMVPLTAGLATNPFQGEYVFNKHACTELNWNSHSFFMIPANNVKNKDDNSGSLIKPCFDWFWPIIDPIDPRCCMSAITESFTLCIFQIIMHRCPCVHARAHTQMCRQSPIRREVYNAVKNEDIQCESGYLFFFIPNLKSQLQKDIL